MVLFVVQQETQNEHFLLVFFWFLIRARAFELRRLKLKVDKQSNNQTIHTALNSIVWYLQVVGVALGSGPWRVSYIIYKRAAMDQPKNEPKHRKENQIAQIPQTHTKQPKPMDIIYACE